MNVGFQIVSYGGVLTAVWYPTDAQESPYVYSSDASGSVAKDADVSAGSFPLVVFSHGYTGCPIQSVFITEQLARNGYIVAAPNHKDAGCDIFGGKGKMPPLPQKGFAFPWTWTDQTYIDRKNDLQTVISGVEGGPFGGSLDASNIAAMGHSLGGYTVLGIAGGWPSWKDSRIKAVLALSPYIEPFMIKKTLGGMNVPLMYQGSDNDSADTRFVAQAGGGYDQTSPPKFLLILQNADHYVWTNSTCSAYPNPTTCISNSANAKFITDYGFGFLDHYLKGGEDSIIFPTGIPAGLVDYRYQ